MRKRLKDYRHAVWDWNGTLLDDTWLCCEALNQMLAEAGLEPVDPVRYRQIFEFPVINVYHKVGLSPDEKNFPAISVHFMNSYEARKHECLLHPQSEALLDGLTAQGLTHSVLSAYESNLLKTTLSQYGLDRHFLKSCGGHDIHAGSKAERARHHLSDLAVAPEKVLYIGDTAHDAEAAAAMGVDCVLTAHGHQDRVRLQGLGVRVVDGFAELVAEL